MSLRHTILVFLGLQVLFSSVAPAQQISAPLAEALEAARTNSATPGQQALLFQNNNVINQAALSGWIPDATYQAAQREYAQVNVKMAAQAAQMEGVDFTPQVSKTATYSPGTDSDYIVKTTAKNPVEQIRKIQENYNRLVNDYLKQNLEAEGFQHITKDNWHNRLDVDFMADPENLTPQQFRAIAKLNNDAYKRRGAAEYERRLRGKDSPPIRPTDFSEYAQEMQDFIEKKQGKLETYRKKPELLKDPAELAEMHRLMAQEAKYVSRIEESASVLRGQEWLATNETPKGPPEYEIRTHPNGEFSIRTRHTDSVAARADSVASRGSKRRRANRAAAFASSALTGNSVERALGNLAEAMAEAHQKNPGKWGDAPARIAEITERMSPQARGQVLERLRNNWSSYDLDQADAFVAKVADEMRQRVKKPPEIKRPQERSVINRKVDDALDKVGLPRSSSMAQQLDDALRGGLGISDDLAEMGRARRGLNKLAGRALEKLGGLDRVTGVLDGAEAISQATTYVTSLRSAMDPNISDKEADEHFQRAQDAALTMAKTGTIGALSQAVPTVGAIMGGWSIGYDGTRFVLENTETGRRIDRKTEEFFQRHGQALDRARSSLTEYFGGESDRMTDQRRQQDLESSYWQAIRNGRIRLKPGVRTLDVAAMLRDGDLIGVHDLIEPGEKATQDLINRLTQVAKQGTPSKTPATNRRTGPPPISSIQFENQTFDLAGDARMKEQYDDLLRIGKSPIGPAARGGRDSLPSKDTTTGEGGKGSASATDSKSGSDIASKTPAGDSKKPEAGSVDDLLNIDLVKEPGKSKDSSNPDKAPANSIAGRRKNDVDDLLNDLVTRDQAKKSPQGKGDFKVDDLLNFDKDDVLTTGKSTTELARDSRQKMVDDLLNFDPSTLNTTSPKSGSRTQSSSTESSMDRYRQRARQINERLVTRERQLAAQQQAEWEARRRAAIESQRQAALAEYERQRQQEFARQRAIAAQQQQLAMQEYARQQQIYRQQLMNQQIAAMRQRQIYLQQQAARQRGVQWINPTNYGNGYDAQGRYIGKVSGIPDGSILGSDYNPRP